MTTTYNTRNALLLLAFFTASFIASAQMVTFEKHYPTSFDQSGKDVLPTADGGYLIAATTENTTVNDLDILVIKTNSTGDILSTRTYGGPQVDYPNNMVATNDGNFFILGYTDNTAGGDMNIYLLKVNQSGDLIFSKQYGGYGNDEGKEIVPTSDGNYVIVAGSNSPVYGNNQMQLIKIDNSGTMLWSKLYGTSQYESARSVKECADGGFIIAGKTAVDITSPSSLASIMLIKTNSTGDSTWSTTISGGSHSFESKSIVVNNDGTYTLAIDDSSAASDSDVRILKLDATGGIIWNKMYGGTDKDICKTIRPTSDGGYIVSAIARSFGWVNPQAWIIKLDANGDKTWEQNYGGSGHEHCYSARQTSDGGYIAIGHARSFSSNWETYFIKMDAAGVVGITELLADNKLAVYPNPSDGIINIDLSERQDLTSLKISNALGQTIYSGSADDLRSNPMLHVDLSTQDPGIYFVTIASANQSITKKLILN